MTTLPKPNHRTAERRALRAELVRSKRRSNECKRAGRDTSAYDELRAECRAYLATPTHEQTASELGQLRGRLLKAYHEIPQR